MLATNAFNIVITITVILIIGSLIYLLIRLMLHNEARYREDKNILTADMIPNSKMKGIVDNYIARVGKFGSFYVMQIDIDNFKGLNELYGPSRCDQVLVELSIRLSLVLMMIKYLFLLRMMLIMRPLRKMYLI